MFTLIADSWFAAALLLFAKSVGLLGLAWAGHRLISRSPAAHRHILLTLGLTAVLVLPILSPVLPRWRVVIPTTSDVKVAQPVPAVDSKSIAAYRVMPQSLPLGTNDAVPSELPVSRLTRFDAESAPPLQSSHRLFDVRQAVFAIWSMGLVLLLLRLAVSVLRLRAVVVGARPIKGSLIDPELTWLVPGSVRVLSSTDVLVPITAGWRRPVILLPVGYEAWPADRLRAVLMHEMAHIRRHDWVWQLVSQLCCCVYWPQPFVWATAKQSGLLAEIACDDSVIRSGLSTTEYATHLLEMARGCAAQRGLPSVGLAMAAQSTLRRRLQAIVNPAQPRMTVPRAFAVVAAALFLAGLLPLAAAQFASQALRTRVAAATTAGALGPQVTLANGVTVELQGLTSMEYSMLGDYWWNTDGTTIPQPREQGDRFHNHNGYGFNKHYQPRLLSFKLTSLTAQDCSTTGYIVGMDQMVGGTGYNGTDARLNDAVLRPGIPCFGRVAVGFANTTRQFSYRFGVAAGAWNTVLSCAPPLHPNPNTVQEQDLPDGGTRGGIGITMDEVPRIWFTDRSNQHYHALLLPEGQTLNNQARQALFLDKNGNELSFQTMDHVGCSYPIYVCSATAFAKVDRIVIQTRPYQWAEFRDIAIDRIPTTAAPAEGSDIATPDPLPAYTARIGDASVVLTAIASHKTVESQWWLPNGAPLAGPIEACKPLGILPPNSGKTRAVIISLRADKPLDLSYSVQILNERGATIGGFGNGESQLLKAGQPGGLGLHVDVGSQDRYWRVVVDGTTAPWRTVAQLPFQPSLVCHHVVAGSRDFVPDVSIHTDVDPDVTYTNSSGKQVVVPFAGGLGSLRQLSATRVVAILRSGKITALASGSNDYRGSVCALSFNRKSIWYYNNPAIELSEVKGFALQTRPWKRVELDRVSVDPTH